MTTRTALVLLLIGLLAAPLTPAQPLDGVPESGVRPLPLCTDRWVVVAVGQDILRGSGSCQPDGWVEASSGLATSATWLRGATPSSVCTELLWVKGGASEWFGAPCGRDGDPMDPRAAEPCASLALAGQAARDLCGREGASATAASTTGTAPCGIQVGIVALGDLLTGTAAPAKPCGIGVPPVGNPCENTNLCNIGDPCDTINCSPQLCPDGGTRCITDKLKVCDDGETSCITNVGPCGGDDEPACKDYACSNDRCDINLPCDDADSPPCTDIVCGVSILQDCDPDLPRLCTGGSYGLQPNCHTIGVGNCEGGIGVAVDGGIVASCIQTPVLCPSGQVGAHVGGVGHCHPAPDLCGGGSYGIEPNCHTIGVGNCEGGIGVAVDGGILASCVQTPTLCPPGTVGAHVGSAGLCYPAPDLCGGGSYGVEPNCHTVGVGSCEGGIGVAVDGGILASCVQTPILCPSGTAGAQVGGVSTGCHPVPELCGGGSYGVKPSCHMVEGCSGELGYKVDGNPVTCIDKPPSCPAGQVGVPPACVDDVGGIGGIGGIGGPCRPGTSLYAGRYGTWCASPAEVLQDSHPGGPVPFVFDEQDRSLLEKADQLSETGILLARPELPDPNEFGPPTVGPCSEGVGLVLDGKPFCESPPPTPPTSPCPDGQVGGYVGPAGACVPAKILFLPDRDSLGGMQQSGSA